MEHVLFVIVNMKSSTFSVFVRFIEFKHCVMKHV